MRIAVRNFQIRPIIEASRLRTLVERVLACTGEPADSISFVFVDDATMIEYHARWVDVPETTDVLSFPVDELDPEGERDLGDVVICTDQAARQAAAHGRSYARELEVLALHGALHLLGYDHERDGGQMQVLESRLRPRLIGGRDRR
jgi:probable rRNA maturation factor